MTFSIHPNLTATCFELGDYALSRVFLKNNADYPWLILVPRVPDIQEIDQLSSTQRHVLMDEISDTSTLMRACFNPDKLNVATLGNVVPQLHIHVVARFKHDKLWPHGLWQTALTDSPYTDARLLPLLGQLRDQLSIHSQTIVE